MSSGKGDFSRRDFLKSAGAAGIGSILVSGRLAAEDTAPAEKEGAPQAMVPTRPFGKSGINVSMLALGGILDFLYNQLLLRQALAKGVTYWDTAESYMNGMSEEGMGKYFAEHPEAREKVFLVTKTSKRDPDQLTRALEGSLKRLNTSHVDLYFLHGLSSVNGEIDTGTRKWAEKAKSDGTIRLFGFSTHSNMEKCLMDAAGLGWIDGIMLTYNYRVMGTDRMKQAVKACAEAGIGLTAMKTQARSAWSAFIDLGRESETATKLTEQLMKKGYTVEQARLKAVWENPHIASICSQIPSLTVLMANVAAAVDRIELTSKEKNLLERHGRETISQYCSGCSHLCESVLDPCVPVAEVMRYLMYARSYGERERAVALYRKIPDSLRKAMVRMDYAVAERKCPRAIPIGRLMREAADEFTA